MPGAIQENEDSTYQGYSFDCPELDVVTCVEFSPYINSSELIALASDHKVSVGTCRFREEDPDITGFCQFDHLYDFLHGAKIQGISWSPRTSVRQLPSTVQFCSRGKDFNLRYVKCDFKNDTIYQTLKGHTSYINECSVDPTTGEVIASVSDDLTCRLWDCETGVQKACLPLGQSPGVSVRWNPQEPNKLMVAEKKGIIRFYDLVSMQAIMSLFVSQVPLMSADWCHSNPLMVGGVALDDWHIWDVARSSLPVESKQAHKDGVKKFRWSPVSNNIFATTGQPRNQARLYHMGHQEVPLSCNLSVGGGISWHCKLPVCAVGGDQKVHLWQVEL